MLDASGSIKGKGISIDHPEMMQSRLEQHNEVIRDQDQQIKSLKGQLDSCEEQFKELEADMQQRLMEKDARDEKYNSLLKAFEGFGSMVKSAVLQLAGWSFIPLIIHILGNQR